MAVEVECSFDGCDRLTSEKGGRAQGLCTAHNMQLKRGSELKPLRKRSPNGTLGENTKRADPRSMAMRKWLADNGYEPPRRGVIPESMKQAYFNAML